MSSHNPYYGYVDPDAPGRRLTYARPRYDDPTQCVLVHDVHRQPKPEWKPQFVVAVLDWDYRDYHRLFRSGQLLICPACRYLALMLASDACCQTCAYPRKC